MMQQQSDTDLRLAVSQLSQILKRVLDLRMTSHQAVLGMMMQGDGEQGVVAFSEDDDFLPLYRVMSEREDCPDLSPLALEVMEDKGVCSDKAISGLEAFKPWARRMDTGHLSDDEKRLCGNVVRKDLLGALDTMSKGLKRACDDLNETLQNSRRRKLEDAKGPVMGIEKVSKTVQLVALNASIEAHRAGDSGASFAVVAEEMRKLGAECQSLIDVLGTTLDASIEDIARH